MGTSDLTALCDSAVQAALDAGADDAEAFAQEGTEREVRVYQGAVESLTDAGSRGLGLRLFVRGRCGYAYGTDLTARGIDALSSDALQAASVADVDEFDGLPDSFGQAEVNGLYSPKLSQWSTQQKIDLALEIEAHARAHPTVSQVEEAAYADGQEYVALANSRGFSGSYQTSSAWAYVSAFAGEGADLMTGLGFGIGRDPDELDARAIADEAAGRAAALVGASQPRSARCPVVLDELVAARFIGFIGEMLSADAAQRGRSLFAGREGQEVASSELVLEDDGLDPAGLQTAPFDGEGLPRRRTRLIANGRLNTLLFDSRTARKARREPTASAARGSYRTPPAVGTTNLTMAAGTQDLDGLIEKAGDGMLVTDVTGLHSGVNPISGTFSVGATGLEIEAGRLGKPAREFTIASDLLSMLRAIEAVGSQQRWVPFGGSVRACPVLLSEMSVSGT